MMPKRILLIIPEMSMGGAQRSLSKLSLELARHHWVGLVVFNKEDRIAYPYGGELISLNVLAGVTVFHKLRGFVQRIRRLRKLKKELGIDVSISFLEGADYINVLSKLKDKIVVSVRGSKLHDETMAGKWSWLRSHVLMPWLYRKADVVVTVNQGIALEMQTHLGLEKSAIITIGNFYDIDEITRLSEDPKGENLQRLYRDPVLITTGRLVPEKGLRPLIRVFYGLKRKNGNLRLVIVGDGREHAQLILDCKGLNLSVQTDSDFDQLPDVLLAGGQSNVFKYLKGARIYLMNSSNEGFPNGLAEAMVCGIPVVSSDCPYGPREILAPEFPFMTPVSEPYISPNGIVMPLTLSEETIQVWIKTLSELLANKAELLRFAENGKERIGQFEQKLMVSKWHDILDGL